jgi:large subunit ribosomal protein L17
MRHRVAHRKLGRVTEHRIALLRNQATALIRHERIETTVPKAKELRPFVERLITIAKRGIADGGATPKALHARRLVIEDIVDRDVVGKLFDTVAPRFQGRPGGYTRILRLGYRRGDSAEVAQVELVGSEYNPALEREGEATEAAAPKKGVGSRLRAAASRLRGKKAEGGEDAAAKAEESKSKGAGARAKSHQAKRSSSRKTGGS